METTERLTRGGYVVPCQEFNGKIYRRYKGERYFTRHTDKLHRVVWEYYNGPIPEGYHVHHKDGDPSHNDIGNLELVKGSEHLHKHQQEHVADLDQLAKMQDRMRNAGEYAKEWHKSEEGRRWHSEHAKAQLRIEREYTCTVCGRVYRSKNPATKYCSNKCNAKARRDSGIDNEERICIVCGQTFLTNRYSKQQICGRSCAAKYRRSLATKNKSL